MTQPIINQRDTREPVEYCTACTQFYWPSLGHHCEARPVGSWWSANTIICTLVIVACVAGAAYIWTSAAHARQNQTPRPVLRPVGLLQAKRQCSRSTPRVECRAALRRALAAVAWQKEARRVEVESVLERTRGKQPYAYAARLAYMACISFSATPSRCRPPSEMLAVGRCESGLQTHDPNPTSTADGWMQYLAGTWNNSTAGQHGYSRYDVLAMGIATEAIVHEDGGWSQWVCKP